MKKPCKKSTTTAAKSTMTNSNKNAWRKAIALVCGIVLLLQMAPISALAQEMATAQNKALIQQLTQRIPIGRFS